MLDKKKLPYPRPKQPVICRDLGRQRELSFQLRELCRSIIMFLDEGGSPHTASFLLKRNLEKIDKPSKL